MQAVSLGYSLCWPALFLAFRHWPMASNPLAVFMLGFHVSLSLAAVSCAVEFAVLGSHSPKGDRVPAGFRAKGFDSRYSFGVLFRMVEMKFGRPEAIRFGVKIARSKISSHALARKAPKTRMSQTTWAVMLRLSRDGILGLRLRRFFRTRWLRIVFIFGSRFGLLVCLVALNSENCQVIDWSLGCRWVWPFFDWRPGEDFPFPFIDRRSWVYAHSLGRPDSFNRLFDASDHREKIHYARQSEEC